MSVLKTYFNMVTYPLRNSPPDIQRIENIDIIKPQKIFLDNDIPVYIIHSNTEDIVSVDFIFEAGLWQSQIPLVPIFTNIILTEGGTKKRTSYEVSELFEFYGANLDSSAGKDVASITISSLNKYFDELAPILQEIIFEPLFSDSELEIQIKKIKQKYLVNLEKPNYIASKKINELILGNNNPYGYFEKLDDFDKINIPILKEFHQKFYLKNKFAIVVTGKITGDFIKILNKYFGQHTVNNNVDITYDYTFDTIKEKRYLINKKRVVQDSIRLGKQLFFCDKEDIYKVKILVSLLGGYFGSRLMKNIREEKGLTYGIYSFIQRFRYSTSLIISAETKCGKGVSVIDEVYNELNKLIKEKVNIEEINLVKNYLLGELQRNFDGPLATAEMYKMLISSNLPENFYDNYFKTILNINEEEILFLASKYLNPALMVEVLVTN